MAKYGITNVSGGGGIGSDEVSVTREYVLNNKTYVGADTDDEIGTGAMPDNKSTANQNLNAGGSFLVKKGYHAQDFTVIANSLASQTSATAIPSHVLNGETFWANGSKLTGKMNVQSILSFSCAPYSASQIIFTWQNPQKGPFSGVIIVGKTGGYPANINDGTRYYKGFGNNTNASGTSNAIINGFSTGTTYYFRAFSYATINNEEWVTGTTRTASTIINVITQVITSSTTWTVPLNVNSVTVFLVGGGAGGGCAGQGIGGAGGGGGYTRTDHVSVTPNQQIPIIIGSGGVRAGYQVSAGGNGGNTSFGTISVSGGLGNFANGGSGGSGGGGGGNWYYDDSYVRDTQGGSGGADGSDSGFQPSSSRGVGQHTTTRAFGESSGTLYSGGGGGGSRGSGGGATGVPGGEPGAGGGGRGGSHNTQLGQSGSTAGQPGTDNSGGGGGGNGGSSGDEDYSRNRGGNGGSGICIIRYVS